MFRVTSLGAGGILLLCALSFRGNSAGPQTPEQLTRCWQDLASDDAGLAYRAFWQLAQSPAAAVKLLGQHLAPAAAPDNEKIQAWLNDLQNPKFAVRAAATKELENLGELAEPALRKVLEGAPDLETRQRVEILLSKLAQSVTVPDKLRMIRAVEVLEMIGSAQAKEFLQRLAKGFPGHRLTREAQESSKRLDQKAPIPERWLAFANGPPPAVDKDDPVPFGARTRLGTTRFRPHHGPGRLALFSPDSQLVISNDDKAIYLWETQTGKLKRKFEIAVTQMAVAPKGTLLALGLAVDKQKNSAVVWWDWQDGKELGREMLPASVTVKELRFSPDGGQLIGRDSDQSLRVWDVKSRAEIKAWKSADPKHKLFGFSADGNYVVIGSRNELRLRNLQKETEHRISDTRVEPWKVAFSADGKYVTVCSQERGLRIWDVATGNLLRHSGSWAPPFVDSACFSPDGRVLAAHGYRADISLWDTQTGKFLKSMADSRDWGVHCISPDGRWLATAGSAIRVWNLATGNTVDAGDGHVSASEHVAFSGSFDLIATATYDGPIRLWDPMTGKQKQLLQNDFEFMRGMAISPDGQYVAAARPGPGEGFIVLWETATGRQVYKLPGHAKREYGRSALVHFSPDSRFLLSWGDDFYLRKWDVKTGKAVLEHRTVPRGLKLLDDDDDGPQGLFGDDELFADVRFSVQGDQFFMLSTSDELHCFEVATGKESRVIKCPADFGSSLAVSPTGTHVAVTFRAGDDSTSLAICELASGKVVLKVAAPGRFANAIFSADGRTIVAAGGDKVVVVEVATGKIRLEIAALSRQLVFSPDGRFLVTAMPDTTALMWDLAALAKGAK